MSALQQRVAIVGGLRTPFGAFGGSLRALSAIELGSIAARAALRHCGIKAEQIDSVVFGNVLQSSVDAIYLARHIGLKAGLPVEVPALTVNRLCGSGFQAAISGAAEILTGDAGVVLAGGTESMSQAPHVVYGARSGLKLGQGKLVDSLWEGLTDSYCNTPMGVTAENLARQYRIDRAQADEYAHRSQQAYLAARDAGYFLREIAPVEVPQRGQSRVVNEDECPRPDSGPEDLAGLPPVFQAGGVVTAGNASAISDGAAALLLAGRKAVEALHLNPLGWIKSWSAVGCEPRIMGIGPVQAARRALHKAGLSLDQMDLVEINEAFAPQYLAVEKELGLDREKSNVNGGAIALGHPLGASGARILLHLLLELERRGGRYGLGAACIGGGQGIAVVVERDI